MNFTHSFYRKIVYAVVAAALLLPIALLARPDSGQEQQSKALLAQIRADNNLSQASLSQVDPTSEIMKLGSLGLHGIAVNVLWNQANEYQEKKAFDKVSSTLDTLILLQPNFISVWEFQGHNLAYNISREFDDYEDRYFWIKEGLNFFMNGIAFNKRDHRIYDNLGLHTGLKLGKSDEQRQFREIFRHDHEYIANQLSQYGITEDEIAHPVTGPDNWLWAYQWYDKSYQMVEGGVPQRTSDLMYWMKRESQLRNFADAMDDEYPPGEASRIAWGQAFDAWLIYGQREITTSVNEEIVFESLGPEEEQFKALQKELDELAPGVRERLRAEKVAKLQDDFKDAYSTPADQRTYRQQMLMRVVNDMINVSNFEVASEVPADLMPKAREIDRKGRQLEYRLSYIRNYRTTVNYEFWRNRTQLESTEPAVEARSNYYRATGLAREAKYQDFEEEVTVDGETKFVKQDGAITLLRKSFAAWAIALKDYPFILEEENAFKEDLFAEMSRYLELLRITGEEWPDDFELQFLIDEKERQFGKVDLPTSSQLKAKSLNLGQQPAASTQETPEDSTANEESAEQADKSEGQTPDENKPDTEKSETEKSETEKSDLAD